jgi:hypothetical protein
MGGAGRTLYQRGYYLDDTYLPIHRYRSGHRFGNG